MADIGRDTSRQEARAREKEKGWVGSEGGKGGKRGIDTGREGETMREGTREGEKGEEVLGYM